MAIARLPEALATLYAELLDQCIQAEAEAQAFERGSFVSKTINGITYWYRQESQGGRKQQVYLGRETPALLQRMQRASEIRDAVKEDERRRRELVRMLVAGGVPRQSAPVGQILRTLRDAGMFRLGGVLIGTHAFGSYANMLGVRFEQQSIRTADVDIAHDASVALALGREEPSVDVPAALKQIEPRFVSVPGLDPREPSTSMKVRGRDLRIDFLTTARRRNSDPVVLPRFKIAAAPLPGIDYLIADPAPAVIIANSGILVNVPAPARFAFHKLWVSSERPVAEQVKARKDRLQAEQLLEVLAEDRPGDITAAWRALEPRRTMVKAVSAALRSLKMGESVQSLL